MERNNINNSAANSSSYYLKVPSILKKVAKSFNLIDKIRNAECYILHNFQKEISLRQLAKIIGTNESYLKAGFKKEYGMSVCSYIYEIRMIEASKLLIDTNLPVCTISQMVGYKEPTNFYSPFRNRFGCSPQQFRKMNRPSRE